ncbi:unnamed protein product [Sphagnum compactum]
MADGEAEEFRCFVGGLSWSTTDKALEDAFRPFGSVLEAKVIVDKETGHSRGFGFVNFNSERAMDDAIESLHGKDLDGRPITVNRAKPKGRDGGRGGDRGYSGGGGRGERGGGGGGGGGGCFKCGQPGHWARECPSGGGDRGGGGGHYSSHDRYGSDSASDRNGGGRYSSGDHGGSDRYSDRYSGGDRRNGGGYGKEGKTDHHERDGGHSSGGGDRYNGGGDRHTTGGGPSRYEGSSRDRSGPYDRPSGGGRSSHDERD